MRPAQWWYALQTALTVGRLHRSPSVSPVLHAGVAGSLLLVSMMAVRQPPVAVPQRVMPSSSVTAREPVPAATLRLFSPPSGPGRVPVSRWKVGRLAEDAPGLVEAPPLTRTDVVLSGIVHTGVPGMSLAVLIRQGEQYSYRAGDIVEGTPVRLVRILADRIIVAADGEYASMTLPPFQ